MYDWKEPKIEPKIGIDLNIIYIAPINGLKYMGYAVYDGSSWNIGPTKIPAENIVCWDYAVVFCQD